MTQQAVADAIGISRSSYANYECDRRQPDQATLVRLADLFNVSVDYILCRNEEQPTVNDDGLRAKAIDRIQALPDPALERVLDFLEGIQVGRGIASGKAAAGDPADKPT